MMIRKAFNILSLSADSEETTQSACKKLDEIAEDVITHKASIVVNEDANVCTTDSNNDVASLLNQMPMLDPLQRRSKGVSNARLKGALEKRTKRVPKKTMQTFHQQLVATSAAPSDFSTFSQQLPISQYQSFQMGSNHEFSFMDLLSQGSSNDYHEYRNGNTAQVEKSHLFSN